MSSYPPRDREYPPRGERDYPPPRPARDADYPPARGRDLDYPPPPPRDRGYGPPPERRGPPRTTLFVAGFPPEMRAADLAYYFERLGPLVRCDIPALRSMQSKPYAFIEYEDPRDAAAAHAEMHGVRFGGFAISIQFAKNAPSANWRFDGAPRGSGPPRRRRSPSPRRGPPRDPYDDRGPPRTRGGDDREHRRGGDSGARGGRGGYERSDRDREARSGASGPPGDYDSRRDADRDEAGNRGDARDDAPDAESRRKNGDEEASGSAPAVQENIGAGAANGNGTGRGGRRTGDDDNEDVVLEREGGDRENALTPPPAVDTADRDAADDRED